MGLLISGGEIVTAEARHGKEIPELKSGDVMVFQKKERLRVTSLVPSQREHAALENVIRKACAPVTYSIKITPE